MDWSDIPSPLTSAKQHELLMQNLKDRGYTMQPTADGAMEMSLPPDAQLPRNLKGQAPKPPKPQPQDMAYMLEKLQSLGKMSPESQALKARILRMQAPQLKATESDTQGQEMSNKDTTVTPTRDPNFFAMNADKLREMIAADPFSYRLKEIGSRKIEDADNSQKLYEKLQSVGRGVPLNALANAQNSIFKNNQIKVNPVTSPEEAAATAYSMNLKTAGEADKASKDNLTYQAALAALKDSLGKSTNVAATKETGKQNITNMYGSPPVVKPDHADERADNQFNTEFRKTVLKSSEAAQAAAKDVNDLVKVFQEGDIGTIKRQIGEFAKMNGESAARFSDQDAKRYVPNSINSQLAGFEKYLTGSGSIKGSEEQKVMIRSLMDGARRWKETFPTSLDTFRTIYSQDPRWVKNPSNEKLLQDVEPQILKQFPKTEYDDNDVKHVIDQAKGKGLTLTPEQAGAWIEENYGRRRKGTK